MNRFRPFVTCVLSCALLVAAVCADDPPKKLTPEERKELEQKCRLLNNLGLISFQNGKRAEGQKLVESGLEIARQIYPPSEFPDGHTDLANSLTSLGIVYDTQGKYAAAEPLYKEALEVLKRLHKGDHPDLARGFNDLAGLHMRQAKPEAAEPLYKAALEMRQRLHKGDHPDVAASLNNLGYLYKVQGKLETAERLYRETLAMYKRLFPKQDHPQVAISLGNLATLYQSQGKDAAAEPLLEEALELAQRLFGKKDHPYLAQSLNNLAALYQSQGKDAAAEQMYKDALAMRVRLFNGDRPETATCLVNLGTLYQSQGRYADAEPLLKDALEMSKRLIKGDHPETAIAMNNLAVLYEAQGKFVAAEELLKDVLEMRKRMFKGDHADTARSMNNLAWVYQVQGNYAPAESLLNDSLEMNKRLFKGDHPAVALGLNNLGALHDARNRFTASEPLHKAALEMRKRLFKGDHPDVLVSLNNLADVYQSFGKGAEAEPLLKEALAMSRRLFKGDHPRVVGALSNLGFLYQSQGKYAAAEPLIREAFDMSRRITVAFAERRAEGEALTLTSALPYHLDSFLSLARAHARAPSTDYDPATCYSAVWAAKGTVARVYERRQLRARAATGDPALARALADLSAARRRRAELILAPATKDPGTLQKREDDLKALDATIAKLNDALPEQLPFVARVGKLNAATAADFQKALPADAAVVDFFHYTFFEFDNNRPVGQKEQRTQRYSAFVVTRDKVAWVDLDTADNIRAAVGAWLAAITSGKEIPAAVPAKVRELVWEKVRKALPATTKTVYLCPDAHLCRVPWAALPGDKPGTILLEDFAVATIPHAPFLLDKLWPQDERKNRPAGALVVGGVKYDADPAGPAGAGPAPLVKPGAKLAWSFLPGTAAEATGVSGAAAAKKLPVAALKGEAATPGAVLSALPKAKYAHLATHGFFADASFRSAFQLDESDYRQSLRGERIGRAANSPLVMTGLVLAGANSEKTAGRGIVTGEALVDLDLSGLELAVLSACETGLGDLGGGGEGVFGLQRAFHYAGARDVVCSLWQVPDQSTAALMGLFYRHLWEKNLAPVEALRQAQLELYRNPGKIAELAHGFRGKFEEVPGMGGEAPKPNRDGTAHPLLWAAFTLSGPGR